MKLFLLAILLFFKVINLNSYPTPLNCIDTTRLCTSFIAFKPNQNHTLQVIESMFDVLREDITVEKNGFDQIDYVFIKKNCFCASTVNGYLTNTSFTVRTNEGSVSENVNEAYEGLAFLPNSTRKARFGAVVSLHLLCGCSSGLWNYLMSYVLEDGDTVASLASRFGVSMDSIESVNGIGNPDNVSVGSLYYIPLYSVPGEPYPLETKNSPTAPGLEPSNETFVVVDDDDRFSNPQSTNFPSDSDFDSTISDLIGAVTPFAIVYGMFYFLKILENVRPTYARISNNESATPASDIDAVKVTIQPDFPVISNSQIEGATMERFIRDMANEKPIRFSPQQLEGFTKKYSMLLGTGGYGIVYKGEFPNGEQVAVKVLNNNPGKRVDQQFMAEVSTIGRTNHINLVRLFGFCFDPNKIALVYEHMENGSLDKFLFKDKETIQWEELHKIAVGTAKGIAYLHEECEKRIIHYDIKPENVLLDANFSPKVADFGLAKLCNRESSHVAMTGCRGTPGYTAPELWKPYPVTHKCDVYSFGMLLFEIVGRRRNHDAEFNETQEWLPRWTWESFNEGKLGEMMKLCGIEERNREKAERMSMVAMWCVQYLPEARPQMTTVVKMLEGGQDISAPPNPFQYLESDFFSAVSNPTSSSTRSSSSSWTTQTSETSHSVPMRSIFEIEKS